MSTTQKSDMPQGAVSDLLVKLGFKVDDAPLRDTIDALKALTEAADHAREALARLGDFQHGGITIKMVGNLMTCEVKPPAVEISGQPVD